MKIPGYWDRNYAPKILAKLTYPNIGLQIRLPFLVDSGSSRTMLLDGDAAKLGIDYSALHKLNRKTVGVGGFVDTYLWKDVLVEFDLEDGGVYKPPLSEIRVLRHNPTSVEEREAILSLPSLIGMDLLHRFDIHLSAKNKSVSLDL